MDIIATVIGFSTIMLILSMVVTSFVQMIHALTDAKALSLRRGLRELLKNEKLDQGAIDEVTNVLVPRPEKMSLDVLVPLCTTITCEELNEVIAEVTEDAKHQLSEHKFKRMEAVAKARFSRLARSLSLLFALFVAIAFQVDAFALLERLSEDAAYRARVTALSDDVLADAERSAATATRAKELLVERHPEIELKLEELSGLSRGPHEVANEMRLILGDSPDGTKMVERYLELVAEIRANDIARDQSRLAAIDLHFAGEDHFLRAAGTPLRPGGWLGILVTTILLTLGAPFWHEQLRRFAGLSDAFADVRKRVTSDG